MTPEDVRILDALDLSGWHTGTGPGFVLGLVAPGSVLWWRACGRARLAPSAAPLDPASVFYVASLSKQFTAACVALLVSEGAVGLDDRIRGFLPELPECFAPVRVRHLIHHIAGVPSAETLAAELGLATDWWEGRGLWECIDLLSTVRALVFRPGDAYAYSNEGYWLLAGLVERVATTTLGRFARERLFVPLSMTQSRFRECPDVPQPGLVDGHAIAPSGLVEAVTTRFHAVGDGGLLTTLTDLAQWDRVFSDEHPLGEEIPTLMLRRGRLNDGSSVHYAWGLSVREHHGARIVSHGGNFIGFEAKCVRFPEYGVNVVCLANLEGLDVDGLALTAANTLLADVLDFGGPSWRETLPPDGRCPPSIVPLLEGRPNGSR